MTGTGKDRIKMSEMLWYRQPAKRWNEALPLGNGRMGAMDYGQGEEAIIQLDESSFWSGGPSDSNNRPECRELLEEIRSALLKEDYGKADRLGHDFVGNKNNYGTNMPVGNLCMKLKAAGAEASEEKTDNYVHRLYLEEARTETIFRAAGNVFCREVFLSHPAQTAVVRLTGEAGTPFGLSVGYEGIAAKVGITEQREKDYLIFGRALETLHSDGQTGATLEGRIRVLTDGRHCLKDGLITIEEACEVILLIDLETDMFEPQPDEKAKCRLEAAEKKGYVQLKEEHIRDAGALYRRVHIDLGGKQKRSLPTDERIARQAAGEEDPDLAALLFQYGRYLLIASSREDSPLPTHMGGIWNDNIYNNIDCTQDMHIDMNIQMQYWLAAQCALPECYQPVFRYIRDILMPSGEKTAKQVYGAKGWCAHVVTNPWGFTSLGWSYNWGVWSLGGVWCATLLWDYYEFTKDRDFLQEWLPVIEGAARFAADYVFYSPSEGMYMTGPSYSPENRFTMDGREYFLSLSPTCDCILIREILRIMEKCYEELGLKADAFLEKIREIREKLPPFCIGKEGGIQEWFHDFEEAVPNHRHTSHLLGLYPFAQITPEKQPELASAARKSISRRLEDFEITSWGMNMMMGYYARLRDGEGAADIYHDTVKRLVKPNLTSVMSDEASMWGGTWELDGNTGMTASLAELFIQSQGEEIRLLPALPEIWSEGSLSGIGIRGGHRADISWKDGMPEQFVVYAGSDDTKQLCFADAKQTIRLKAGEKKIYHFVKGKPV